MKQLTFDEISSTELTDKDRRVLSFLRAGNTQSQTSQKSGLPKATVNKIAARLEKAKLIRKKWDTKYNIIYATVDLPEADKEDTIRLTNIRTHNIAMKFKIERQNDQLSFDKRAGFNKDWYMRGKVKWYAYWFQGKMDEPDFTITVTPKTLIVRMDKGGSIRAASGIEARSKGYQLAANTIKLFCAKQREFGVIIEASSTGKIIGKAHGGFILKEGTAAERAGVTNKEWWIDASVSEVRPGYKELESMTFEGELTPLDNLINVSKEFTHLPELIRSTMPEAMKEFERTFAPLTAEIHSVMAHIQSGQSVQNQINQLVILVAQLVKDNSELKKKLEERGI